MAKSSHPMCPIFRYFLHLVNGYCHTLTLISCYYLQIHRMPIFFNNCSECKVISSINFLSECKGKVRRMTLSHVLKADNRVFSTPVAWPVVTMETVGQTNPVRRDGMVWALSAHYIMLIRPQQALPLVRIY